MFDRTAFSADFDLEAEGDHGDVAYPFRCAKGHIHYGPDGPWESHGVMHLANEPRH